MSNPHSPSSSDLASRSPPSLDSDNPDLVSSPDDKMIEKPSTPEKVDKIASSPPGTIAGKYFLLYTLPRGG